MTTEKQIEKGISEIMGVFTDPIIVFPGGWGDTLPEWLKNEVPEDIRVESLTDEQMRDLNRLKEWLYRQRIKARMEKDRAERRQKREEADTDKKTEQPALFEF